MKIALTLGALACVAVGCVEQPFCGGFSTEASCGPDEAGIDNVQVERVEDGSNLRLHAAVCEGSWIAVCPSDPAQPIQFSGPSAPRCEVGSSSEPSGCNGHCISVPCDGHTYSGD